MIKLFPPALPELQQLPEPPVPRVINSVLPAVTVSTLHEYAPTPPSPPFGLLLVVPPPPPPAPQSSANIFVILAGTTKFVDPAVLNSLIVPGIKFWLDWAFSWQTAPNKKKPVAALINPHRHDGERPTDFLRCRVVIFVVFVFCIGCLSFIIPIPKIRDEVPENFSE